MHFPKKKLSERLSWRFAEKILIQSNPTQASREYFLRNFPGEVPVSFRKAR